MGSRRLRQLPISFSAYVVLSKSYHVVFTFSPLDLRCFDAPASATGRPSSVEKFCCMKFHVYKNVMQRCSWMELQQTTEVDTVSLCQRQYEKFGSFLRDQAQEQVSK